MRKLRLGSEIREEVKPKIRFCDLCS